MDRGIGTGALVFGGVMAVLGAIMRYESTPTGQVRTSADVRTSL